MTGRRWVAVVGAVALAAAALTAAPASAVSSSSSDIVSQGRVTAIAAAASAQMSVTPPGVLGPGHPTAVRVLASGLSPLSTYALAFDGRPLGDVSSNRLGDVAAGTRLPAAGCGNHVVSLTLVPPILFLVAAAPDATTIFRVLCPAISVSPSVVVPSELPTTFTVTPSPDFDFASNDQRKVLLLDGVQIGIFNYKRPIFFTAAPDCGVHLLRLVQPSQFGLLSATTQLTVACPTVAVAPSPVGRGDPHPVSVSGASYEANAPVSIAIDGVVLAASVTDGTGSVVVPVNVRRVGCGKHQASVTETANPVVTAAATLIVRCATLNVDPSVITAGMTTHVTGSGFTPGAVVTLGWRLSDGTSEPVVSDGPVVADASGHLDFFCLVLQHDDLGARTLIAKDKIVTAQADAVVEGGTMQPSGGGDQLVFRR